MFDIFRVCNFAKESGQGVPSVVNVYGEDAYIFSDFYINVVIPFNRDGFNTTTRKMTVNNQKTLIKRSLK